MIATKNCSLSYFIWRSVFLTNTLIIMSIFTARVLLENAKRITHSPNASDI